MRNGGKNMYAGREELEERRRRKTRRRKRQIRTRAWGIFLVCLFLLVAVHPGADGASAWKRGGKGHQKSVQGQVSQKDVRGSKAYRDVLEHPEEYPADMAEILENNPQLLEFVSHYREYEPKVRGAISEEEKKEDDPLFLQWDERWGYAPYGEDNIGFSGCGPTCLSMVIFSLTGEEEATPDAIADLAMREGYYQRGSGTTWALMTEAPGRYGVSVRELGLDERQMKARLEEGGKIIASMRPGDFTTGGHFIEIYGYGQDGFLVNDPNSAQRSGREWPFEVLRGQIKNMWAFAV